VTSDVDFLVINPGASGPNKYGSYRARRGRPASTVTLLRSGGACLTARRSLVHGPRDQATSAAPAPGLRAVLALPFTRPESRPADPASSAAGAAPLPGRLALRAPTASEITRPTASRISSRRAVEWRSCISSVEWPEIARVTTSCTWASRREVVERPAHSPRRQLDRPSERVKHVAEGLVEHRAPTHAASCRGQEVSVVMKIDVNNVLADRSV